MMRLTNADGTSCVITKEELASAFNRWMNRYLENPEAFEREWQVVGRFAEERTKGKPSYGDLCAEYLLGLMPGGLTPVDPSRVTLPPFHEFRCETPDATQLDRIEFKLHQLMKEVKKMAVDQAALDAAVAQEVLDVADVATKVNALAAADATAFADLQAKIAANPTAPVADFTDEVNKLAGNHSSLAAASAALATALTTTQTNDPGAQAAAGTGTGTTGDGGIQTITG